MPAMSSFVRGSSIVISPVKIKMAGWRTKSGRPRDSGQIKSPLLYPDSVLADSVLLVETSEQNNTILF